MEFTKTIRFKLTLWYSGLLILLSLIFVVGMNLVVTEYYRQSPTQGAFLVGIQPYGVGLRQQIAELNTNQQNIVEQVRQEDLRKVRLISVITFVPIVALSFIGGYIIAGQMLDPLQKINKATKEIDAQNLNRQIDHPGVDDEIGELVTNFNLMISRLDRSFELQKQFVENASHELKTPLTSIKANLESILMTSESEQSKELQEQLELARASSDFMNKLIEDLLLLSVLEDQVQFETLSIADLLESTAKQLDQPAKDASVHINFPAKKLSKSLQVKGNSPLLQRAIMNIVENAVKFSPPQSKIDVQVQTTGSHIKISVKDSGPGIAEEHLDKIFERFYRVDKSRAKGSGGSGLGLAITKRIIEELHGGKLSVKSISGLGSEFVITLPALAA